MKDAFDILELFLQATFWLVVGTVTIFGYLGAKRTLFQPMRTEIFKAQLEELSRVLSLFGGKNEIELRTFHGLDASFYANCDFMLDEYALRALDIEVDRSKRSYAKCPLTIFKGDYADRTLTLLDGHVDTPFVPPAPAPWDEYEHGEISLAAAYESSSRNIDAVLGSPLLPSKLRKLLERHMEIVFSNVILIADILTAAAPELPERYPASAEISRATHYWLWNRYTNSFNRLDSSAQEIVDYIRNYYAVDRLFDG